MISQNSQPFNKMKYIQTTVNQFINKESFESVTREYSQLNDELDKISFNLDQLPAYQRQSPEIAEKKEILKKKKSILSICYTLFKNDDVRKTIVDFKNKGLDISKITPKITQLLLFLDLDRNHDKSNLCCDGMLSTVQQDNGTLKKDVKDIPISNPAEPIPIKDLLGNTISIQQIGRLYYSTASAQEYINKYRIIRYEKGNALPHVDVYSEIDLTSLSYDDRFSEYYLAVANQLLSKENIEKSNARGYIGKIITTTGFQNKLTPSQEKSELGNITGLLYNSTYQISPNTALYYDCEPFEAISAYLQQENEKNDGR